jgi:hypothetical protein
VRDKKILAVVAICLCAAGSAFADASPLVDPTRPGGAAAPGAAVKAGAASLRLTFIRLGTDPLAVVNGRSLRIGDAIDGRRVAAIQPGRVVLAGAQGQQVLSLVGNKQSVSSPATSSATSSIKRRPTL